MKNRLISRIRNRILSRLAMSMPGSTSLRPLLHRLRGVQIKGKVFIGDDVYLENEYPECVTIEEGAQICLRSTIIAHTRGHGNIFIGKNAFIGAGCMLIAPVGATLKIGEGAVISAGAVITADVPARVLMAAERPRPFAEVQVPFTMKTGYGDFMKGLKPLRSRRRPM